MSFMRKVLSFLKHWPLLVQSLSFFWNLGRRRFHSPNKFIDLCWILCSRKSFDDDQLTKIWVCLNNWQRFGSIREGQTRTISKNWKLKPIHLNHQAVKPRFFGSGQTELLPIDVSKSNWYGWCPRPWIFEQKTIIPIKVWTEPSREEPVNPQTEPNWNRNRTIHRNC